MIPPRIVKIRVGPPGTTGREWSELYMTFDIERSVGRTPNKAKVEIYNLSPASVTYLEAGSGMVLQVLAGEITPTTLFYGDVKRAGIKTKINHPNQVTTIEAIDGKRAMQEATFSRSYPAGTTRSQILADVLAANAIPRGYVAPIPEHVYQAPVAYGGTLAEVLDELYWGEFAAWSLQDGALQLVYLGQATPGNAPLISEKTGMIGSPERSDKGVKVSTSQLGAVKPGGGFAVQSRLVSGSYRATKVNDKGDTELTWQSDIVGVPIGL